MKKTGKAKTVIDDIIHNHAVVLTLPNRVGYERLAMASLAAFARQHGFPPDRIEDLKTVVSEAAINAIRHGNRNRAEATVTVTMDYRADALRLSVIDQGSGIRQTLPDPDIQGMVENRARPSGFGIYIIRQLVDRIEFLQHESGGHEVRMVVTLKTEQQGAA